MSQFSQNFLCLWWRARWWKTSMTGGKFFNVFFYSPRQGARDEQIYIKIMKLLTEHARWKCWLKLSKRAVKCYRSSLTSSLSTLYITSICIQVSNLHFHLNIISFIFIYNPFIFSSQLEVCWMNVKKSLHGQQHMRGKRHLFPFVDFFFALQLFFFMNEIEHFPHIVKFFQLPHVFFLLLTF